MANPSSVASVAFGEPERCRQVGSALRAVRGTQISTTTERQLSGCYAPSRHDGQLIATLATAHAARPDVGCDRENQPHTRSHVGHESAYGGPHALHGARSPTSATAAKAPPRPRYAGAVPFIDRCRECPYQGKAIGPRGNPASRIILVGEAPGAHGD